MTKPRLLTKSRFKKALECPSKLFYTGKPEFPDQSSVDAFLMALADGGFQIGELAKAYFPGGVEIETRDYDEAVRQTSELLANENATIFEAAFRFGKLVVFVDVVRKNGDDLRIIEVKSKTFEPGTTEFVGKKGGILAPWKPYLYDIAYQKHVARGAFPDLNVSAYLMLVDKTVPCPSNRLNQKFRIKSNGDRRWAEQTEALDDAEFRSRILTELGVDDICEMIYADTSFPFNDAVELFADSYERDEFIPTPISKACKSCEFQATAEELAAGLKSGRHNCWQRQLGWMPDEIDAPTMLDIWDNRRHERFLKEGKLRMNELTEDDLDVKSEDKPGLSRTERQWLQVTKTAGGDDSVYFDREGWLAEAANWKFPLHFIDFETATPAIPFNLGRRPYEEVAFQFSHHIIQEDGRVEHRGQFLKDDVGVFPNFEFLRALKRELEGDEGTIFRYADHENSYLRAIRRQIMAADEPDEAELCAFIDSITSWKDGKDTIAGAREMVDMRKLVLRYYYAPSMGGSNSIKRVLPAVLASSEYLRGKYSGLNYGTAIRSLNYPEGKSWVEIDQNGRVKDPYSLLEKMYASEEFEEMEESELKDGGAATINYARLQFEDLNDAERGEIRRALLRYCELDTLAMVMIHEAWRELGSAGSLPA